MSPVVTARVVQFPASPLMPSTAGPIGHHHGLRPSSFAQAAGPFPINPFVNDSPSSAVSSGLVNSTASAVPIPQFHNSQSASTGGLAPIPGPCGSLRPPGHQAMPMAPSAGSMLAGGTGKSSDRAAPMPSSEGARPQCNPAPPNGSCMAANSAPAPPRSGSCASRHMAAEQRRRARINERLEALREIVPHSARANTAAFLTEVYDYISSLHRELNKRGEPCTRGPKIDKVSAHEETGEGDRDSQKDGKQGSPQAESPSQDGSHGPHHDGSSPGKPGLDLSLGLGDSSLSPAESPKGETAEDASGARMGKVSVAARFPNSGVAGRMPGRTGAFSAYVSAAKATDKGEKSLGQPWPNSDACPETSSGKLPRHAKDADHNQKETGSRSASIGEVDFKSDEEAENNEFSCSPDKAESLQGERFGLPQRAGSGVGNLTALYTTQPEGSLSRIPFCGSPHSVLAPSNGSDVERGGKSAGQAYGLASSPSAGSVMPMPSYLTGAAHGHGPGMMLVGNNQAAKNLSNGSAPSRKRKDAGSGPGQQQSCHQQQEEQGSHSYNHVHGAAHTTAPGGTSSPAPPAHPGAGPPSGYPVMVPMLPPMHPVAMAAAAAAAADAAAAAAVQQWNMAAAVAQAQAQAAVQAHAQAQALASAVAASSASAAAAGTSHLSHPHQGPAPRTLRPSSPPHPPQMVHAPPQGVHRPNTLGAGGPVGNATRPVAVTSTNGQVTKRRRRNTHESKDGSSCVLAQKVVRPIAVRPRP